MQILYLALNNLKVMFKDKMAAFWYIALPLVLTLIIGSSMGGSGTGQSSSIPVAVLDQEQSAYSQYIIDAIAEDEAFEIENVTLEQGKSLVESNEVAGFINISPETITFYPSAREVSPLRLEKILEKSVGNINNSMRIAQGVIRVFNPELSVEDIVWEVADEFNQSPIRINYRHAGTYDLSEEVPLGMNQSSPGMAVMFTLMVVVMSGANTILEDRKNGTLARLIAAPISKAHIIAGRTSGVFLTGLTQMIILILVGQFLLGVNWGQDISATLILTIAFVFSATGLSMTLASLCKNPNQLGVLGNIIIIAISMLGGAFWPVEMLTDRMQLVSRLVPTGWAISGYTDIILRGLTLSDIWVNVFVLSLFGLVFLTVGIFNLKLE